MFCGRPPASRFVQSFGLMSTWTPPQWQAEFLRDLRARRPALRLPESRVELAGRLGQRGPARVVRAGPHPEEPDRAFGPQHVREQLEHRPDVVGLLRGCARFVTWRASWMPVACKRFE